MIVTSAVARFQCAAITNGCMSALAVPVTGGARTIEDTLSAPGVRAMLQVNGWHLDHGRWVCGNHERSPARACDPELLRAHGIGACYQFP